MADDFVNEIYPLNQIRPVSPHPSGVREKRRQKREKREDRKKKRQMADKVSLGKERPQGKDAEGKQKSHSIPSPPPKKKKIDITV